MTLLQTQINTHECGATAPNCLITFTPPGHDTRSIHCSALSLPDPVKSKLNDFIHDEMEISGSHAPQLMQGSGT